MACTSWDHVSQCLQAHGSIWGSQDVFVQIWKHGKESLSMVKLFILVNKRRESNTILLSTLRGEMSIDYDNLPLNTIHIVINQFKQLIVAEAECEE